MKKDDYPAPTFYNYKTPTMKFSLLFATPIGRTFLLSAFTIPIFTSLQTSIIILLGAFVLDFLTGILASYIEIKNGSKPMPVSGFVFTSAKARDSIVKAIMYMVVILGAYALEYVFFDKKVGIKALSSRQFGITELVVCFCIAVEVYSAVVENGRRAGFDIIGKITGMATSLWDTFRKVKGE